MVEINSHEITPEHTYVSRRKFLVGVGALLATTAYAAACKSGGITPAPPPGEDFCSGARAGASTDELGAQLTSCEDVTNYNNYYEFSTGKETVADMARGFKMSPWQIQVGGLVNKPRTFGMEDLLKFSQEERIYRLRCVEAWSMVIPWTGFPLATLLKAVEPTTRAKYVRFETLVDPAQMPGQRDRLFDWPYAEGLRLDEATHNLTLLATGLYGKPLPPQDGGPIRLVAPWKYGFKSVKAIVKIDLVEEMPVSFWMSYAPNEYGFYANVNPDVSHPRWSQSSERRIGDLTRMKTLPFNGYANEMAPLYAGMDLRKLY